MANLQLFIKIPLLQQKMFNITNINIETEILSIIMYNNIVIHMRNLC